MKRRRVIAAAITAVLGLALAGGGGIAQAGGSVRGVDDDEIRVGGLGPAFPFKDFGGETGVLARFKVENDKGGVFGRELNYVGWGDDQNSADTNLAETRRLVEQEDVLALVPVLSPNYLSAAEFAEQQHVPAFGWGISRGFCETKYAFGFSGCLTPPKPKIASNTWGGLIDVAFKDQGDAKGAKGKTAAVISEDNDSGRSGKIVIVATAEAVGMEIVYDESSLPPPDPAPVTDFSPYVNELMTSNDGEQPDVIFLVISQDNLQGGFQTALNDAGFDGIATNAVLYSPQATALVTGGSVLTQFSTPEAAGDIPAVQEFVDAVDAVKKEGEAINQPTIAGYIAADMFIKALKKAGKNPTPEKVQKAAAHMVYELEGFVGPTKYPKGFKAGTPCGQLVASDGTEWTIQVPFQCFTNINVKTLKKIKY